MAAKTFNDLLQAFPSFDELEDGDYLDFDYFAGELGMATFSVKIDSNGDRADDVIHYAIGFNGERKSGTLFDTDQIPDWMWQAIEQISSNVLAKPSDDDLSDI